MPLSSSNGLVTFFSPFDMELCGHPATVEFGRKYSTDFRGRYRIHHCLMRTIDCVDLDLTVDVRRPDFMRWLGFALRGYEKQNIAPKLLWQERPHETNAVLISIDDGLIMMFLEDGEQMSVVAQGVHHILYRVSHASEENRFVVLLIARAERWL